MAKKFSKDVPIIRIRGARMHNLRGVDVDIPRGKLVVMTGLSGSGKSSLAFDTIYAEAERRFVESLSSYARQFLGVKEKPDVESIEGLSPAIAIDQKSVSKNPRSTVGTITEIYDYMRILYARAGEPHCPTCGRPVMKQSVDEIVKRILGYEKNAQLILLAPVIRDKKGEHKSVLHEIQRQGFLRVRVDGEILTVDEAIDKDLDPKRKHEIFVVVDRFTLDKDLERTRVRESLETALTIGKGVVVITKNGEDTLFSQHFACPVCGVSLPELEPRLFSFNSPYGACPECTGLGTLLKVDADLVFPNPRLTLAEGAIQPWSRASHRVGRQSWYWWMLEDLASRHNISFDVPIGQLSQETRDLLLYGEKGDAYEGIVANLERRWKETDSEWTRAEIERYMREQDCSSCHGTRLKPEALGVRLKGKNIAEVSELSVERASRHIEEVAKSLNKELGPLMKEIAKRLEFLLNVGLGYLTLDRGSVTLSGGEAQRVRLATQIGSQLTGVLYVLDEPSIGLHARDHALLLATLKRLRDLGNSVIVVEHDRETMMASDWIVDLGPGAGVHGGNIMFSGTPKEILKAKTSTGAYLSGKKKIVIPRAKGKDAGTVSVVGATAHNLKNVTLNVPLGKLVCVAGISGSGKSTLVNDTLATALLQHFYNAKEAPAKHERIDGLDLLDKVVVVDQSPIGRTPRSNPATYTGLFGPMRDLFASTREARARGYSSGRFSFNVKGGRCEVCEGQGVKKIEMYFLPDIYVECEECKGKRYNREALDILYKGKTIADVLEMSCEDALKYFDDMPQIANKLRTLVEVGLGYMKLGQSATTLSGGEAQRIKLATELAKKATGKTLYILDEPTTGLHFEDIQRLLSVLASLRDRGNTVLVIEHNTDVIENSDWVIDMGPEGGEKGGLIVAEGAPRDIIANKKSVTGKWLRKNA